MDKIKILHLITSLNIGGTEKFLLSVLTNLSHKYNFAVGYLKERGQIADEIEKFGIPVKKFGFFSLRQYLKENKIQIIHTHLYRANILGRITGKLAGVPTIISSQRSIDGWKRFYHVWLDKITSKFCNLIIANSESAKNILTNREKIPAKKIVVVYNGFDLPSPPPDDRQAGISHLYRLTTVGQASPIFTVGYIGRLHREKGVYLIPEIAKLVFEKNSKLKFLIYGDGPERQNLKSQIDKYNLQDTVEFLGWQADLAKMYSTFGILLLPSEEESFPQAALEAMSCGIPVIAADVGGVSELVENKKTGILINDREPESFAKAILSLTEDHYCYNQFSANSKLRASDFTIEKMINSIDKIYSDYGI